MPSRLSEKLKSSLQKKVLGREPLWEGPEGTGPNGGVTASLLSRFLVCRERFRLRVVEGLKPVDQFNHRVEYGHMWHTCEEALARGNDPMRGNRTDRFHPLWEDDLLTYAKSLCQKYPLAQEQIDHWYQVCKAQFPIYVNYWKKQPDVLKRTALFQEKVFDVSYTISSGKTVRLRGKWDSVDLIGIGKGAGIYLQENKTKGDINEGQIKRQLTFDLQTMLYLVALQEYQADQQPGLVDQPIKGVRYNVVRRPLSGGKGTIVRHKATQGAKCPTCKGQGRYESGEVCRKCGGAGRVGGKPEESPQAFYKRVTQYIESEPSEFFARWKVEVTIGDVKTFRRQCLDPVLEQLCEWWDYVSQCDGSVWVGLAGEMPGGGVHWRHPFGVFNIINEGGSSDLDEYLATGSEIGLQRTDTLFAELG